MEYIGEAGSEEVGDIYHTTEFEAQRHGRWKKTGLEEDLIGIQQHYVGRNSFPERRDT